MARFTDLFIDQDSEGFFDAQIENGDFKLADGLSASVIVSLFSDRRAYKEEVADPLKRRGWIGDLVSETPDRYGSGLWLHEQARLNGETVVGVRNEAVGAFNWAQEDKLINYVEADVTAAPQARQITLNMTLHLLDGGVVSKAFVLADNTRTGLLARL